MTYRVNDRKFRKVTRKFRRFVENKLPKDSLKVMKDATPLGDGPLRGNAKRKTILKKTRKGFTLTGNYPYSGVIDRGEYPNPPKAGTGKTRNGYSTQAPDGVTEPTIDYIEKTVKKMLRRTRR